MTVALTRIVANWERSGQGDGGRTTEEDKDAKKSSIDKEEKRWIASSVLMSLRLKENTKRRQN